MRYANLMKRIPLGNIGLTGLLTALCLAALLFNTIPAHAQSKSILPASFAGWTASSRQPFAPPAGTQAPAIAGEYGFDAGEQVVYIRGTDSLNVTLYKMKDPSGAYGEYSYLRTPEMPRADLTAHSAMSSDRALALDGNLLLDVSGRDLPKLTGDLKALVAAVAPRAETGLLPSLTDYLPHKDFVDRSDRYILGPVALNQFFPVPMGNSLGFSQGAEAEIGRYKIGERDVTLLVADYPTPQTASKTLTTLQQQFDVNDSKQGANATPVYAKRSLTLVAFVAGAKSQAEADLLLKQIHSDTELTWNEPTFALTEPSIGTMIVGTIVGTGIICLFALISGLAFGGVRLIVKRALPNRVFDRSDQLQILQLGLASKPINAEDFYGLGSGRS